MKKNSLASILSARTKKMMYAAIFIAISMGGIIAACTKSEQASKTLTKSAQDTEEAFRQGIIEKAKTNGITITIPINKRVDAYLTDKAGNRVYPPNAPHRSLRPHTGGTSTITSACDGNPNLFVLATVMTITTKCNGAAPTEDYEMEVSWSYTIYTDNNIVATNPNITRDVTKGTYDAVNGTTLLYSQVVSTASGNGSFVIADNGTVYTNPYDPGNPYEQYTVTFTTNWIDYLSNYTTAFPSLVYPNASFNIIGSLATNCSDGEQITMGSLNVASQLTSQYHNSSLRAADPIEINTTPNTTTHSISIYGSAYGYDCPTGYNSPASESVEYRLYVSGAWTGWMTSGTGSGPSSTYGLFSYTLPAPGTYQAGTVSIYAEGLSNYLILVLPAGTHTVQIQSQNVETTPTAGTSAWTQYPQFTATF